MKRWALIAGAKGNGKSTTAARAAAMLAERGVRVAGFVQEAIEEDGERRGYRVRRVGRSDAIVIAKKGSEARSGTEEAFCSFVFDRDAFASAGRWLAEDAKGAEVVFIDEVSKLEVAAKGHHDAITASLATDAITVLAVRADQLFYVTERFGLEDPVAAIEVGEDVSAFVEAIMKAARS
jgi:nucleoside-triphosphatase THEP1